MIYLSIAAIFFLSAIIWQGRRRQGLYVFHVLTFFAVAVVWPLTLFVVVGIWALQQDFLNRRVW